MTSPTTVLKHAEGHQALGYPASKPDVQHTPTEKSGLISGTDNALGTARKPHIAFLTNPNQYQGADDRKPQHPNHMSSEQLVEAALELQKKDPQLTPSQTFMNTYTPSPAQTPSITPTLTRS